MIELWPALQATTSQEGHPPSFFELTTALAWTIGRRGGADYIVTEAGIGGQYDATNAIDRSDKITVIMPIGYDHLEILGNDLESIARNKADVIPRGGLVVMAPQIHQTAAAVVRHVCLDREAHLVEVAAAPSWQRQAGLVADVVLQRLDDPTLDRAGSIAPVHLPGRMEMVAIGGRQIILDGADNPMKLRGVQEALEATEPTVLVAALSHEKQLEACAAELVGIADVIIASDFEVLAGDRVVRRSWSAVGLARALKATRPEVEVHVVSSIERAVASAVEITKDGETIVATGSFMMLDPVRTAARASLG
jgi:dihydrofolate synthase/folylpolyglutamate synthase